MKITTTILREPFDHKPVEVMGRIQNTCVQAETIELTELCDLIAQGCTFKSCDCGKSASDFHSGMLFSLDFDNKDASKRIDPEEAISIAVRAGFKPSVMYRSFSSTDAIKKFRLIFVADRQLTDRKQWEHCQNIISAIYPEGVTDHTNNPNRCFFGTDKGIDFCEENQVSVDLLLSNYVEPKPKTATTRKQRSRKGNRPSRIAQAIADHDSAYIRRYMGRGKRIVFDNRQQFFDYIYKTVNLADFLGVDENKKFHCILPSHDGADDDPSASVFRSQSGVWLYNCFAEEGKPRNIKQIVELLGNFDSEYQSLEFLKDSLNLKIKETQWAIEQRENIDSIVNCLCGTDENAFSSICPLASHNLRNCKMLLLQVLCIARNCIYPERTSQDRNIIFYMSVRQLAKDMGKKSTDQIDRNLKLLTYHKVIKELPDEEIPPQFLQKAYANRRDKHSRVSFYEIPSWVVQRTQLIEQQGKKWKDNGYRIRGISYEMFLRSEGQEVASEMYPQYSRITTKNGIINRRASRKADEMHDMMTEVVITLIQSKGYCTEADIAEYFTRKHGKNITELQIKRSIGDIMTANNLHKQKCNKSLKQRLSIDSKGYPIVILPNE